MNNIKLISTIFICINLLNGCGFASKSVVNSQQNIKQNETNIEDLPDGNHRYCSEPASEPNINGFDGEAWCFEFNKKGNYVVGTYSYQAPKDTAQICIEGQAKNNQVTGVGYEILEYGETKPDIEKEKLAIANDFSFTSEEGFWDTLGLPNGLNLKVNNPEFYKLLEPEKTNNYYWIWVRFNYAELDTNKFYQRELRKYSSQGEIREIVPVSECDSIINN